MSPPEERSHRFNMMLSVNEHAMLTELADLQGVSAADVFRQLLRQAHREALAGPVVIGRASATKRGKR